MRHLLLVEHRKSWHNPRNLDAEPCYFECCDCDDASGVTPMQLTETREALHLKQIDLARALGMSANAVNRWEKGTRPIPPYLWLALEGLRHQACRELAD